MKNVLIVCPSSWDDAQLARARDRWSSEYHLLFHGQGAEDSPSTFHAASFIADAVEQLRSRPVDGVTSSSDYPGCLVAAAITEELRLPGPAIEKVLLSSHKYYARLTERPAVPEATPRFSLLDPQRLDAGQLKVGFPLFVKPVKSWFSVLARRVDTFDDLAAFAALPEVKTHLSEFVAPFNELVARYADFAFDGSYLLAEEAPGRGSGDRRGLSLAGTLCSDRHCGFGDVPGNDELPAL